MSNQAPEGYKETIRVPATSFAMRAQLPLKEPLFLQRWQKDGLFGRLQKQNKSLKAFSLHDGPPYANGHLHLGHALNKVLKDFVVRSQQMMGRAVSLVPGWDCHGLPIEWKVEEEFRRQHKDKEHIDVLTFRHHCRLFAQKWIGIQSKEFQRLGLLADWEHPYTTMSPRAEALIVQELGVFLLNGLLYKGFKTVMWSPVEKTALAEAEIEYKDKESVTVTVAFNVVKSFLPGLEGAAVLIWTTTPWTIPANRAICYSPSLRYGLYAFEGSSPIEAQTVLLAENLKDALEAQTRLRLIEKAVFWGRDLHGTICSHPLVAEGYSHAVPLLEADYVTDEAGTGFVHTAPAHGEDDFATGKAHGLALESFVQEDGRYDPQTPLFAGLHIYKADPPILEALQKAKALLAHNKIVHSYPHSWRSKKPVIYRASPQWFIAMDDTHRLRKKTLKALESVRFLPAYGKTRLMDMVAHRPDWCVSRQRLWGVPIAVFICKETGEPLRDSRIMARIVKAFMEEGADAWFKPDAQERFLKDSPYHPADYDQVTDILDVWFDSGATHAHVLEDRADQTWPADLYLEGSDQHRGWFQSSLMESMATRGKPPYKAVLTHGFVLDEKGQKMSKSLGNIIAPLEVCDQYGADILRLCIATSDIYSDLRIGQTVLTQTSDMYRRFRNTLRFLLGNLNALDPQETEECPSLPPLEHYILTRLEQTGKALQEAMASYGFHEATRLLFHFCNAELSNFYFDVRKDVLYCDHQNDTSYRSCRFVLNRLFRHLCGWMAPILPFTAEEAWDTYKDQNRGLQISESIHLSRWEPFVPIKPLEAAQKIYWGHALSLRRVGLYALEEARRNKHIGAALGAHLDCYAPWAKEMGDAQDLADILLVSSLRLTDQKPPSSAVGIEGEDSLAIVSKAVGQKCVRCWRIDPQTDVTSGLCPRCQRVLSA